MTAHIANTRYAARPCASPEAPPSAGAGPLAATDALVLAVRDARRAARHYRDALGMRCTAYTGPETGNPHLRAYVLEAGGARWVVGSATGTRGRLARHLADHGEGVLEVALRVPDVHWAFDYAVDRGALAVTEPHELSDRHGTVVLAAIGTGGPVRHVLVDRTGYTGPYLPGYVAPPAAGPAAASPDRERTDGRGLSGRRSGRPEGGRSR
ncbi:VOC family protein [Streptomyces sp. NRRL B-24484]|uniref:VOC family protein n=1 Tax=Streptomyces sp. NRRL B-24484 TaxID=1463833 RepID=UPI000693967E|nr:VOC family protein [Streptomyces sp. NRRL B-24484]